MELAFYGRSVRQLKILPLNEFYTHERQSANSRLSFSVTKKALGATQEPLYSSQILFFKFYGHSVRHRRHKCLRSNECAESLSRFFFSSLRANLLAKQSRRFVHKFCFSGLIGHSAKNVKTLQYETRKTKFREEINPIAISKLSSSFINEQQVEGVRQLECATKGNHVHEFFAYEKFREE